MRYQEPDTFPILNPIVLNPSQSAQIGLNKDLYEGFLVYPDTKDPMDVDSFCANVVQAMGQEAGSFSFLLPLTKPQY